MDVKIDPRDNRPRWLDLNPRIGRGHYYLKVGGVDLARAMLADMRGESIAYQRITTPGIFTIIAPQLANSHYIRDKELLAEVRRVKRARRPIHPLAYGADRNLKRMGYRLANNVNQWRRMRQFYPAPTDSGF